MRTTFIYVLKEPDTEEIRYVGKSDNPRQRLTVHLSNISNSRSHKTHWIQSLVSRGLKPGLETIDEVPFEYWQQLEVAYIEYFREQGSRLTNTSPGGGGSGLSGDEHPLFGKHHSEATKQKMSDSASVRQISEEGRQALRDRKFSNERNEKISLSKKGKPKSPTHIEAARQGRLAIGEAKYQKILQLDSEGKTQTEIGNIFGVGQDAISTFLQRRRNS